MMAEIMGKTSGLCGGKGGSMHVTDATVGAIGANGIAYRHGMLYVATGDGNYLPQIDNAQDPGNLLGKLLRLDPELPPPHVPGRVRASTPPPWRSCSWPLS